MATFVESAFDAERRYLKEMSPETGDFTTTSVPEVPLPPTANNIPKHLFPYIVCNFDQDILGIDRLEAVREHFSQDTDLETLYNADDATCFVTFSSHSVAETAPSHLGVVPLLPAMKLPKVRG